MELKLPKTGNLSKKNKVLLIVSSVLFVIFVISGGYLLWRVKQSETIAPEDSEAALTKETCEKTEGCYWNTPLGVCTGEKGCKGDCPCYSGYTCVQGWICCQDCPFESKPEPDPCGDVKKNEKEFNDEIRKNTYNILDKNISSFKIGPFPEGATPVLYYKSFNGSDYRPQMIFSYNNKEYKLKIPPLDSNNRVIVVVKEMELKEGGYISILESDDDPKVPVNPQCNPGDMKYKSFGWMEVNKGNTCGTTVRLPPTSGQDPDKRYTPAPVSNEINWANNDVKSRNGEIVERQCWADWREWQGDYDFDDYFLQIGYSLPLSESEPEPEPEPEPACGTYSGSVYEATQTEWSVGGTFCSEGEPSPEYPVFPAQGGITEWSCMSGINTVYCSASRLNPGIPPSSPPLQEPTVVPEVPVVVPQIPVVVPQPEAPVVYKIPETGILDDIERPVLIGGILIFLGITWFWVGKGMYYTVSFLGKLYKRSMIGLRDMRESMGIRRKSNMMRKETERRNRFEKRVEKRL